MFYWTPSYLTKPLSFIQRKCLAKLRLGCLELRLETGRWARPRLPVEDRLCQVCENQEAKIEDEIHFLFYCNRYIYERENWYNKLLIPPNFTDLAEVEKLRLILNDPNNVKLTAQHVINTLEIRSKVINQLPMFNTFHLEPHDQCLACHPL